MSENKRPSPRERASHIVEWWISYYKVKVNNNIVNDLVGHIRDEIESAIEFQWTEVHKNICPKCGGDFLEYGARPSAPGGRTRFNSFRCNKCGDWFYQDDPRHSHLSEWNKEPHPCPLCKSDKVKHQYSGARDHRTYASFEANEKHVENPETMKSVSLECTSCGFEWERENCPYCDSLNTHLVKDRLNYQSGREWWHYCQFYACFACGRGWLTTAGGSD